MQAEIDRAAGIIWRYLNEHVGWLAREEKLSVTKAGKIVSLSLRTHQTA